MNTRYRTRKEFSIDLTINWQGGKRIPNTLDNPNLYQVAAVSRSFWIMNGQMSKTWKEKLDLYIGVENLFNTIQPNPILSSEDQYFDGCMIWGSILGRNIYCGMRFAI